MLSENPFDAQSKQCWRTVNSVRNTPNSIAPSFAMDGRFGSKAALNPVFRSVAPQTPASTLRLVPRHNNDVSRAGKRVQRAESALKVAKRRGTPKYGVPLRETY